MKTKVIQTQVLPGLTDQEVKHVADLAKLDLTKEDLINFQKQLTDIVEFVGSLKKVDTQNIEPTSQVTGLENVFREDEVTPSLTQEEVLSSAKRKYKGYFVVDAIFEG